VAQKEKATFVVDCLWSKKWNPPCSVFGLLHCLWIKFWQNYAQTSKSF